MSRVHDEEINAALRDGLRRLAAPVPSADFDTRVLKRLRQPQPWWRRLWDSGRPILAGAACSCLVMLAAIQWTAHDPVASPRPFNTPGAITRPLDMTVVDRLLNSPNLSTVSLLEMTRPDSSTAAPDAHPRSPQPKKRVSRLYTPLIA